MRLDAACEPAFARHETFQPRYGWVKKAVDSASKSSRIFNSDDAVVELGVGKNMVRAIRYWGLAYRVIATAKDGTSRVPLAEPTHIGRTMFSDGGWDPYCELPGTQWLLHWWLLAPGSFAPVWWLAFNEFPAVEFSDEQLEQFVLDRVRDWSDPHPSSVGKDVSCLLRMYVSGGSARSVFDDAIDCPTRELRLVVPGSEKGQYRFSIGPKPTLPPAIAAFAALDFMARTDHSGNTVTISKLATEPGGPGRAFKLTEPALVDLLERATVASDGALKVATSNGVPQLTIDDPAANVAAKLLWNHYRRFDGSKLAPEHPIAGKAASTPTALEVSA